MEQIISYGYRKLRRPGIDSPLLTFCSFPVCSMRIRTTSIKEEFLPFFASVACSFISRSTTVGPDETLPDGKVFLHVQYMYSCIVYSTEYFWCVFWHHQSEGGRREGVGYSGGWKIKKKRQHRKETWWYLITRSIRLTLAQHLPVDGAKNSSAFHWLASFFLVIRW